jgi:CRP-like cAMP-binding protein
VLPSLPADRVRDRRVGVFNGAPTVARHLLDLAAAQAGRRPLIAKVTQQELADAVGTVREVVARTLRELRRDGVVNTGRAGVAISSPERLLAEAYPDPAGVAPQCNTGP